MSPPHNPTGMLAEQFAMLGLPLVVQEPEVLRADLERIQAKTLARYIAKLLNENEPLLRAESSDATVTVSEIGGCGTFSFTIHRGGDRA